MTVATILPQDTPRSLEVLLTAVRTEADCPRCEAPAGKRCTIHGRGVHLHRFVRAYTARVITADEMALVLAAVSEVFTVATIVRPPAADEPGTIYRLGFDAGRRCGRRDGDR